MNQHVAPSDLELAALISSKICHDVIGPVGQGVSAGEFAEALRMMQAGHAYANVHTPMVPSGEIRGQINDPDQKEFDK